MPRLADAEKQEILRFIEADKPLPYMQKPFLKWAGGKFRLLPHILPSLPHASTYIEPFAGSAAVWLNAKFDKSVVCDRNADLIALYSLLKKDGMDFIRYCQAFFVPKNNTQDAFYEFREKFNATNDARLRAALLVYLNRHCFNGLTRYNSKGEFNTPFGKYKAPYFPLDEMLAFHEKARHSNSVFFHRDFRETFKAVKPGDVVYCDPPYVPLSKTASFTAYDGNTFSLSDQSDLARLAADAAAIGATVIISNHDTSETRKFYSNAKIIHFPVQRMISCKGDDRKVAPEVLAVFHARAI